MYTQFFQLKQAPFSIAPDPRYLFMSERHREALAHLLYGVGSGGGFVLLTGEIGAGKTTVCRCLLEQIPENCRVAYIFNPKLSVNELLQSICEEFRIEDIAPGTDNVTAKHYVDALNAYLLHSHAQGKNNVLIIDEAQNLAADVLEQLRLLTNLETNERKLLQVILIGQPELRAMLARPELEQLAQRVIARYHLDALTLQETAGYIHYRMSIAGAAAFMPFAPALMPKIHRLTRGVPRRINLLCDRALLGAYAANLTQVTPAIIDNAAREVFGSLAPTSSTRRRWQVAAAGVVAGTVLAGAAGWSAYHFGSGPDASVQEVLAAQAASFKLSHSLAAYETSRATAPARLNAALQTAPSSQPAPAQLSADKLEKRFGAAMQNQQAAYRLLGQLWGVALKQGAPCDVAQARDLHCYRGSGGLAQLQQLNRPAILTLHDSHNIVHYAVLTQLTDSTAVLRIAGAARDMQLEREELGRHFRGEFHTFWRAPPGFAVTISPGDRGEAVDWLAAQFAKLEGHTETIPGQPYGPIMTKHVRAFQQAQRVPADGIAGPQTLMLLNVAAGVPEPRLAVTQPVANASRN